MINLKTFAFFLLFSIFSVATVAQTSVSTGGSGATASRAGFMALSEVREGMKGTALTVFRGNIPEEFNVEILGVVPGGIGPKQDLIVGRISGGQADRTAVFAGMSGSPVYINGKLVGAISYSFPFSKEAICGITPIEQMVSIFEQAPLIQSSSSETPGFSFAEMASTSWQPELPRSVNAAGPLVSGMSANSMMMAVAGQSFRRIGTPLTFTGISQEVLDVFAPQLMKAGLVPVSAVGGSALITPMKNATDETLGPGTSVSMQLTRGDYSMAAAGTVTMRDGDKIYAFGHPFLSLGTSDLPMSESSVVAVIPNVNNSFKMAVPTSMVGTMTQDRATGVFGKLGQAPKMIPVTLNLETSRGQRETLRFEIARDEFLTPLLLNITIYNSLTAQERAIGESTVSISGEIAVKGHQPVRIDRRFASGQASQSAAGAVALPVNNLIKSRFDELDITGINLRLKTSDGSKTAALERMAVDRVEVKAGETVEVQAFARTNSGRVFMQKVPVTIPAGTPEGEITVKIGDGASIQKDDAIQKFVPNDLADLIGTMNRLKMSDRLYLRIFRTTTGAIIGSSEMPNLPPSMLATLNNNRMTGGVSPVTQTVVGEVEIAPAEFVISGEQTLKLTVVR